jgi:hypothetical protein
MREKRTLVLDVRERPAGKGRVAEPAQVGQDDAVALGERVDLRAPLAPIPDRSVEQDDRRAVAGLVVRDLDAGDPGRGANRSRPALARA